MKQHDVQSAAAATQLVHSLQRTGTHVIAHDFNIVMRYSDT